MVPRLRILSDPNMTPQLLEPVVQTGPIVGPLEPLVQTGPIVGPLDPWNSAQRRTAKSSSLA